MKQKILLVEDQQIVLKIIENQLLKAGFDVTCCDNGKDAKEYFDKEIFHTVLTDLLMPQACGLELLYHIRTTRESMTPVIIFSEISMEDKAKEAMLIGANYYMRKPFDMTKLITTLKTYSSN